MNRRGKDEDQSISKAVILFLVVLLISLVFPSLLHKAPSTSTTPTATGPDTQVEEGEEITKMSPVFGRKAQIVLFGDSITEQSFLPGGWGAALANAYSRKADIIVRGYGGYNTRWALNLLDHIFPLNCPTPLTAVTVFFGANDAALLGRMSQRQHVPTDEYKENLCKIVNHLKKCSPDVTIVLITPPPIDENGRMESARSMYGEKAMDKAERTNEMAGIYAKHCISVANELGLPCIDLSSHMQETPGWHRKFLRDGLHLTEEGNVVVFRQVMEVFEKVGLLHPQDMEFDFPHHSEIDGDDPSKAFRDA